MYKSLVQLKGRNGLYIVPSLTFWFFCVKTKEHIHKKLYKFVSFVQLSLLTFLCLDAKKVSKEKSRQTQWLRLFCHASATPCGIVVTWCCHLATYFRLTDKLVDFGLRLSAQHDKGFDLSDKV